VVHIPEAKVSQKDQGNKQSEKGMMKREDRGQAGKGSIKSEEHVGSSDGNGIRFKVHDMPDKSDLHSPEK